MPLKRRSGYPTGERFRLDLVFQKSNTWWGRHPLPGKSFVCRTDTEKAHKQTSDYHLFVAIMFVKMGSNVKSQMVLF